MKARLLYFLPLWMLVAQAAWAQDDDVFRGRLQAGDAKLKSGEYYDKYTWQAHAGDYLVIDLYSSDFDPYLILVPGGGKPQVDNDNFNNSSSRSQLSYKVDQDMTIIIQVTTSAPNTTGRYMMTVANRSEAFTESMPSRLEQGVLSRSDTQLTSGEYYDTYEVEAVPGQRLSITLQANGFDPYLIVKEPNGEQHENDEVGDDKSMAQVELTTKENGTYKVFVTSFSKGETGSYTLNIETSNTGTDSDSQEQRDTIVMAYGQSQSGNLQSGDATTDDGSYADYYAFEGRKGDNVIIELTSSDLDPYLALTLPDGSEITNDDLNGDASRSQIEFNLPGNGRYRISATTYEKNQTGSYRLSLRKDATDYVPPFNNNVVNNNTGGRSTIYGIFMGIENYGGRMNNLRYTAQDARVVKDALVQGAGMPAANGIVLTESEATVQNFKNALRTIASRITPNDMFVLFYSGHGGRYERNSEQMSDPDGKDESIELYDAEVLDDEMSALLEQVRAKTQLIVLDACFSGGFAKDVISKPHRMGMFSSEEDVTSGVAGKFRAGGYLSAFFADALTKPDADEDGDGQLSSFELSQYIYERYRGDVKAAGDDDDDFVFSSRNLGYQKLVVDRGSIRPNEMLFKRR